MTFKEAANRIEEHAMIHFGVEGYRASKITEALRMAVSLLRAVGELGTNKALETLDHIRELAKAETEDRLLLLPFEIGSTVFELVPIYYTKNPKCKQCDQYYEGGMGDPPCCFKEDYDGVPCYEIRVVKATIENIGFWLSIGSYRKFVFKTRQEAEMALKKLNPETISEKYIYTKNQPTNDEVVE